MIILDEKWSFAKTANDKEILITHAGCAAKTLYWNRPGTTAPPFGAGQLYGGGPYGCVWCGTYLDDDIKDKIKFLLGW